MVKIISGERIARQGRIFLGCCAVIFDEKREKILLTRRSDNGRWCLPGGQLEPGESVAEACTREVLEETGLTVHITKLIGTYSSPHRLHEYPDGNRFHIISLCFEAQPTAGDLSLSNETTEYGYFSPSEMETMDIMEPHVERIHDAFKANEQAFIR